MKIGNIRLRTRPGVIKFKCEPAQCAHEWEPHLWEHGDAYCGLCGSLAEWLDDPRISRDEKADARPGS